MRTGLTVLKNTGVLLLGRGIAIALGVVYIAALSRYVQASGMGIIATATSFVAMLSLLLNFGLNDVAIRDISADRSRVSAYLPNLFFLRGVFVGIFFVLVLLFSWLIDYPPTTITVILIYGFVFILDELTLICFSVFSAYEKMEYSAALQTGRDILNMLLSMAAIALHASLFVIVSISVLASFVKLILGLVILKWKFVLPKFRIDLAITRSLFLSTLPFAAMLFVSVVAKEVDVFVLSLFRPEEEVGWYSSAALLVNYLLLVPGIFLQAIFPVFSKFHATSPDELKRVYSISFKYLLLLGCALSFGTFITAGQVIDLVFGAGFEQAATVLMILSPLLFWIFGYANGSYLNATGGQGISTRFAVISVILTVGLSLTLTPRFGLVGAALTRIIPGAILFIPLTLICHKRLSILIPYMLILKSILAASIMAGCVLWALCSEWHLLLAVFVVSPLTYGLALFALGVVGRPDVDLFFQMFNRKKLKVPNEHLIR
jgi:O-antigen/teichoic acid export membrane protein